MLILNSVNSLCFNTVQIVLRSSSNEKYYAHLVATWSIFSEFFYDLLIASNGLALLRLYRHVSKKGTQTCEEGVSSVNKVLAEPDEERLYILQEGLKADSAADERPYFSETPVVQQVRKITRAHARQGHQIESVNSDQNSFLQEALRQQLTSRYSNQLQSFLVS